MTHALFKSAYGSNQLGLLDTLLKVHDAVPNSEKRAWSLLAKVSEQAMLEGTLSRIELLAGALEDAARKRLTAMVKSVASSADCVTHEHAVAFVKSSEMGSALHDIINAAEQASMQACALNKRVDASLSEKSAQRNIIDKAKGLQIAKAREGRPISLVDAIELAKSTH